MLIGLYKCVSPLQFFLTFHSSRYIYFSCSAVLFSVFRVSIYFLVCLEMHELVGCLFRSFPACVAASVNVACISLHKEFTELFASVEVLIWLICSLANLLNSLLLLRCNHLYGGFRTFGLLNWLHISVTRNWWLVRQFFSGSVLKFLIVVHCELMGSILFGFCICPRGSPRVESSRVLLESRVV